MKFSFSSWSGGHPHRTRFFIILTPVFFFLFSLTLGQYHIPLSHVLGILAEPVFPVKSQWTDMAANIVLSIRPPRIIAAVLIGASLASCGAVYQGLFHNPLASPYTLGVSNGAGFGAALAIVMFNQIIFTQIFAIIFSFIAVGLTFFFSGFSKSRSISLILAGIVVSSFFSALVSLMKFIADPEEQLPAIVYWLMGSLAGDKSSSLPVMMPVFIAGMFILYLYRWRINLLCLGEEEASSFGVDVRKERLIILIVTSFLTAAAVSIAGVVGWVGLVIPHFARLITGPDYRKLIPLCFSLGASYMLIVDDFCRCLSSLEIPLGVVTALVGTPLFAWFIMRKKVNF